jgi:hypothetical protein
MSEAAAAATLIQYAAAANRGQPAKINKNWLFN